jgi:squalene-associated FAD-dependent desaturase
MNGGRERNVVVVGAGVAGLAAADALTRDGASVTVLERRPLVGGRAYSYLHPALDEMVDSQHVLVGCCTNLIEFCDAAGLAEKIRWYDRQTFLQPASAGMPTTASEIAPGALPAPMQYAGSFLRASMLTLADKLSVARGLQELLPGYPATDGESVASWYRRTRQTAGAIRHFWDPVLIATLNDSAENCSLKYAGKVFHELFLRSSGGGRLGIPTVPLSEFYAAGAAMVERNGGKLQLRAGVERIVHQPDGRWALQTAEGEVIADDVILALPFEQTQRLLAAMSGLTGTGEEVRADLLHRIGRFLHAPFISILLWYDRQICDLDHAWLLDTNIQWFFHKSRIRRYPAERGSYVELVIAGSRTDLPKSRAELLQPAIEELQRFFPEARRARLVKSGILKEARATFSVTPGLDAHRPDQQTGLPGLFLAGDWTRTEWPSTMEGAARSGRLAAGAVRGQRLRFLAPELPPSGLMPWIIRADKASTSN